MIQNIQKIKSKRATSHEPIQIEESAEKNKKEQVETNYGADNLCVKMCKFIALKFLYLFDLSKFV